MPYLQVELDAKKKMAKAAVAAGVAPGVIAWGLLELWEYAWETKREVVGELVLDGCLGPDERLRDALVAFDFLEPVDGGFRVRGAGRYLRIRAAQSEGGKRARTNLKRGNAIPHDAPGSTSSLLPAPPRLEPEVLPGSTSGSAPALAPSTEHRPLPFSSKTGADKQTKKPRRKPDVPTDPRHTPLVQALTEAVPAYAFRRGRDAKAVSELLTLGEPDEVVKHWKRAWAHNGYPTVRSLSELVTHWNHFGSDPPTRAARGRASEAEKDWSNYTPNAEGF